MGQTIRSSLRVDSSHHYLGRPTKFLLTIRFLETLNQAAGSSKPKIDIEDHIRCDDHTMPSDSLLASYGETLNACALNAGTNICRRMKSKIEAAGFINVQEKQYKIPIGEWAKHLIYKDAGRAAMKSFKAGVEGWAMFLLTQFGRPKWTPQEVKEYVGRLEEELDRGWHVYWRPRKV